MRIMRIHFKILLLYDQIRLFGLHSKLLFLFPASDAAALSVIWALLWWSITFYVLIKTLLKVHFTISLKPPSNQICLWGAKVKKKGQTVNHFVHRGPMISSCVCPRSGEREGRCPPWSAERLAPLSLGWLQNPSVCCTLFYFNKLWCWYTVSK